MDTLGAAAVVGKLGAYADTPHTSSSHAGEATRRRHFAMSHWNRPSPLLPAHLLTLNLFLSLSLSLNTNVYKFSKKTNTNKNHFTMRRLAALRVGFGGVKLYSTAPAQVLSSPKHDFTVRLQVSSTPFSHRNPTIHF